MRKSDLITNIRLRRARVSDLFPKHWFIAFRKVVNPDRKNSWRSSVSFATRQKEVVCWITK